MALKKIKQLIHDVKNRPLMDAVRGIFTWISVICSAVFISSLVLILFPIVYVFSKERHLLHELANLWGKIVQFLNPWWTFEIIDKENLAKKGQAVVYVANHQSQVDILALFIISTRFRWLSKASLFKIPIFGWAMSAIGYVSVVRRSKKSRERCMRIAAQHLKHGTPMIFFPEGTRSKTGELGAFKEGAFRLAHAMHLPIIPITINGCAELLPKGSLLPNIANVTIHIHEPIQSTNLSSEDLMLKAREVISTQLVKDKNVVKEKK
ncbi:MAG: 1-acylglycerol-3-phosphate O-acyltransferase [Bdellovibrionota bacterium]